MKFLVIMDPLAHLSLPQDTTVGFMNAASAQGHELHICTSDDLYLLGNQTWAMVKPVTIPQADEVVVFESQSLSLEMVAVFPCRVPFHQVFMVTGMEWMGSIKPSMIG